MQFSKEEILMNFTPETSQNKTPNPNQSVANPENLRQLESRNYGTNNAFGSFLFGVFVTVFISLLAGTSFFFYFNNRNESLKSPESSSQTTTPQKPEKETKIIERTIEKTQEIVPVPQIEENEKTQEVIPAPQEQSSSPESTLPKIEIESPTSENSTEQTEEKTPTQLEIPSETNSQSSSP
jgi:hypothetical protein